MNSVGYNLICPPIFLFYCAFVSNSMQNISKKDLESVKKYILLFLYLDVSLFQQVGKVKSTLKYSPQAKIIWIPSLFFKNSSNNNFFKCYEFVL